MPENSDITIANLPSVAQGGPPEVSTLVEHAAESNPPDPGPREPSEAVVPSAVPGASEKEVTDFGANADDDDDADFFIKDIVRPDGAEAKVTPTKVPAGAAEPAGETILAEPATPSEPQSQIDPQLLTIADSFGLSREEAESYGSTEALLRTLNIIARNLPGQEDTPASAAQPRTSGAQAPRAPEPPAPEPELEFPDVAEMEAEGFDPRVIKMAKSMKAMHDRYKAKLEQVEKVMPDLVGQMQRSQAEARERAVDDSFREAGFNAKDYDAATRQKIVARVSGLYKVYQAEGVPPPVSDLIRTVIPLVVAGAKPAAKTGAPALAAPATEQAAAKRRADAAALAKVRERNGVGQFVRGAPTHRQGGVERPSALRQTLIDKGIDPGQGGDTGEDTGGGFLKG